MDSSDSRETKKETSSGCWLCDVYEQIESLGQNYEAVKEENRLLKELFETEKMKTQTLKDKIELINNRNFVNMPDYAKETPKGWGIEHIAEESGWVKIAACVGSVGDEAHLYVNGISVLRIATGWSCIAGVQIAPVQAGDKYIAKGTLKNGGDLNVSFFPYRRE
jgi:hypothetical protein